MSTKNEPTIRHGASAETNRSALCWEILIVLAITFGTSGLRAIARLVEASVSPQALNQQRATLNKAQSTLAWLDPALQLLSSGVLVAWGGLAMFLLLRHAPTPALVRHWRLRTRDWLHGAGLAAIIGLPGLAFYAAAVHLGLSKQVVPTGLAETWWRIPLLVVNSWANGFAEELVVVAWLSTRLRQLRVGWAWVFAATAILRGSYHLYQGYSAGVGNIVMGLIYLWYFKKTGRIWPLVIGHGLIDTVAFVGYAALY
ncbi:CPBP family intramembrane glutamic endopeptidase [Corynebacterium macclintockiae]|uniref:CPBP family intramembrane metalloprotease n=1 Tax=Corynebacterium macclintockiae TaxID=2913501 RepID=A0A9X3M7C0_9CORY|nr:CPBP family intramembrane glutamic endopeptidase [Corynebacterium macclintockiae]MCZ9305546.1 CPBP family intramembrane metalloprotease [Corynebacterium macclintockiae]